ncbi:MAG TPA: RNA polymerase sigma factor [Thermoanaerobaculia bacterium]|nr:RNA polymerase sigma factor [Thermoanaerobaculia bacterium]
MRDERQDEDDELVRYMIAYQAGELAAFERLYAALAAELERYFSAAAPTGSVGSAAQDLVQDTFLAIHRSRRTYLPPLPVRPWIFGIARNVLGRHRRTAWRRGRHEERTIEPNEEGRERVEPGAAVEPRDVAEALRLLPAGRRQVWVLHHVHGWSFQQIAARFQIGVGAAKLRSSRAMKALRASLGIERGARDG